jgi:uncharacterized membrane protein
VTNNAATAERLRSFSDGVFAVIITVLVLDLHAPGVAQWSALVELWPVGISYAASYLFVAIVWVNHHHLLKYAELATSRLIWFNFVHLFTVSLLPFTTSWMANTDLGGVAVCAYAGVFVLVNASYIALYHEAVDVSGTAGLSPGAWRLMRLRSFVTLVAFACGGLLALWHPYAGFGLVCACLLSYLRPDTGR